jgi:hypothetical protein
MPHKYLQVTFNELLRDYEITIPTHQRDYVWDYDRANRFILSVMEGLPTQCLFLYFDGNTYSLEDGHQRYTTLKKFINGDFGKNVTYNGRVYETMTIMEQMCVLNYKFCIVEMSKMEYPHIVELFNRLNSGKSMSPGSLFNSRIKTMKLVKLAQSILEDGRAHAVWGKHKETKTKPQLANAMAIASGVAIRNPDLITSSYDVLGKDMFKPENMNYDDTIANDNLQKLYDVYNRADELFNITPAEKKKQFKIGVYTGYILYTMMQAERDWEKDKEMWAKYIARVRRDATAMSILRYNAPASRNWTSSRWKIGLENVERSVSDTEWCPGLDHHESDEESEE